jgi:formate hydrogenlyase subunit 5
MKRPIEGTSTTANWIRVNMKHKLAGHHLLTFTGLKEHCIVAHWLSETGAVEAETLVFEGVRFPSLSPNLPEIAWDEREIHDLLGYIPDGHPDLRPLIRTPRWPEAFLPLQPGEQHPVWREVEPDNPARRVDGDGVTVMKVGPTHAGIIESGHFVFSIIGENVLHLDAHLFQNHRGVEKALENRSVTEALPLVSRICGADSASHQFNFITAIEKLAGREVPESIRWQRIALLESERILSHLNDVSQIPAGVGFQVAHQRGLTLKETWQRGLEAAFGHRYLFDVLDFVRTPVQDLGSLQILIQSFEPEWTSWRRLVDHHHGFRDRMHGVGVVRHDDARRLGAVGVAARASGLPFDVRSFMPFYDGVHIGSSTTTGGDVGARFDVRLQEVERSIAMLKLAVSHLKAGWDNEDICWQPPEDLTGEVVSYSESPHGLNAHMIQIAQGCIDRYHIRSGAFRNWPVLASAVAGNAVADFPLINKSFELCYSCSDR